ncbi:MAG TPA: alpha/beta fold hydrolase [Gemmatimonadaceae bacterium]|nr:alpha/beta fold hydrolase [Gemmatimonadaceae bacterium]
MNRTLPVLSSAVIAAVVWRTWAAWRLEREVAARLPTGAGGIIPGAEPITLHAPGGRAVLLLHGFGDTPHTMRYLAADLHARGWAVHAPLLPGHGRTMRDFALSGAGEWLDAARDALRALRERYETVAVVGLSMGGALATLLAAEWDDLPALVLIAPYLDTTPGVRRVARWHRALGVCTAYLRSRGERSIHDPEESARALSYRATTPRLLGELARLADRARASLGRVTAPTLVVQSREDNRLSPAVAERAFAALGARDRRLVWLEGCGHVVTVDHGRERVFELVREWLDEHAVGAGTVHRAGA